MSTRIEKPSLSTGGEDGAQVAIEALAWLAADEVRLERFLAISGLGPHNLRRAAAEPKFLAAILDYIASNETLLILFAQESARRPEDIAAARAALSGPEEGHS